MARNQIDGIDDVIKMFKRLGKVPQRSVTKAAKAGAKIPYKTAKNTAPVDKGNLKKGLKLVKEKRRKLGKAVYQVTMDPKMGDVFIKPVANPTTMNRSSDPTRAYYPASQEHGFFNHWAGRRIQGLHFMRKSIDTNKDAITEKTLDTLGKELDKEMRKGR